MGLEEYIERHEAMKSGIESAFAAWLDANRDDLIKMIAETVAEHHEIRTRGRPPTGRPGRR